MCVCVYGGTWYHLSSWIVRQIAYGMCSLQDINGHKLNVEFTRIPRPEDRARDRDRGRERRRSRSPLRERRRSPLRDRDRDRDRGGFGYRDGGFRDTRGGGYYDPPPRLGPDMGPYGPPSSYPPLSGGYQGPPSLGGPPHPGPNSRRILLDTPSKSQHPGAGGGYGPGPGGPPPSRGGYGGSQPLDDMGYGRGPPPESGPPGRDSYGPPPSRGSYSAPGKCQGFVNSFLLYVEGVLGAVSFRNQIFILPRYLLLHLAIVQYILFTIDTSSVTRCKLHSSGILELCLLFVFHEKLTVTVVCGKLVW